MHSFNVSFSFLFLKLHIYVLINGRGKAYLTSAFLIYQMETSRVNKEDGATHGPFLFPNMISQSEFYVLSFHEEV